MSPRVAWRAAAAALLASSPLFAQPAADSRLERAAERRFLSAEQFYGGGRYAQALRDFEAIVETMAGSSLADDAALRIAQHRFEMEANPDAAEDMVDRLLREFPAGNAVPGAHLLLGRIAAESTPPRHAAAVAEFERALNAAGPSGSPWSFAALFGIARVSWDRMEDEVTAGALLSALHETDPVSGTAAERLEARFLLARALARLGEADAALAEIASLRADLLRSARNSGAESGVPEAFDPRGLAERASGLATLVARHRAPDGPEWRFDGAVRPPRRLDEPRRIRIADGVLHVLDRDTDELQVFSPTGDFRSAFGIEDAWDLGFTRASGAGGPAGLMPVVAAEDALIVGGNAITLRFPSGDGSEPLRRVRAVAATPEGFWVWDDRVKAVLGYARSGLFLGKVPHPPLDEVRRVERHPAGHLVVIEERQGVLVFDASGQRLFPPAGELGLAEAVDLAFDDLGHLIVLGREGPTLAVYDRALVPVVTLTGAEWSGGSVRRPISLDAGLDGTLFVLDDSTRTVAVLR